jgi:hypothetical protein
MHKNYGYIASLLAASGTALCIVHSITIPINGLQGFPESRGVRDHVAL